MMTLPVFSADTRLGMVTLLARDLGRLTAFYQTLLGLETLRQTADEVVLGVTGVPLLRLENAAQLPAPAINQPGLYHTAFLLPTRADLGHWLAHAARLGLALGSGDHLVSEAFYLNDPEGNGIEVYADRPRDTWVWENGHVKMDTLAVDGAGVLAAAGLTSQDLQRPAPPYLAPAGLSVGHIHLKVGNAAQAAQFYRETLGMELVAQVPGAAFLSWGGYHHHIGLNEWHSRGQGQPTQATAGLGHFEIITPPASGQPAFAAPVRDPWGNQLSVHTAASLKD